MFSQDGQEDMEDEDEDEDPDDLLLHEGKHRFEKTPKKREADKELKPPPPNYFI